MTTNNDDIANEIRGRIKNSRPNLHIIENVDSFDIAEIKAGILTVWVNWSFGYLNCIRAIEALDSLNFKGIIYILDIDSIITADKQIKLFGHVLHGWGEIFIIRNGQIEHEFIGKESSKEFINFLNQKDDIIRNFN